MLSIIVRESLELSAAERAEPLPDEKEKEKKVHVSIVVDVEDENEGVMATTDPLTLAAAVDEADLTIRLSTDNVPDV